MARTRLFHAVIMVGASWGATLLACSAETESPAATEDGGDGVDASPPTGDPDGASAPGDAADERGLGVTGEPSHEMPDGSVHDAGADGDAGWPPTK